MHAHFPLNLKATIKECIMMTMSKRIRFLDDDTVGCDLNLEGKLEFSSYLASVLVLHWIRDERLSSIYTNSFHAYCYERWAMGHIPIRAHTRRTEQGRVRVRAPTTCGHECSSIQETLEPETFFGFYLFKFYLKLCFDILRFSIRFDLFFGSARELMIIVLMKSIHEI